MFPVVLQFFKDIVRDRSPAIHAVPFFHHSEEKECQHDRGFQVYRIAQVPVLDTHFSDFSGNDGCSVVEYNIRTAEPGKYISAFSLLPSILISISVFVLQPFFFRDLHEMFGANVAKRGGLAFFGMVETEAAFVHHAAGFGIAVIITAPDSCK